MHAWTLTWSVLLHIIIGIRRVVFVFPWVSVRWRTGFLARTADANAECGEARVARYDVQHVDATVECLMYASFRNVGWFFKLKLSIPVKLEVRHMTSHLTVCWHAANEASNTGVYRPSWVPGFYLVLHFLLTSSIKSIDSILLHIISHDDSLWSSIWNRRSVFPSAFHPYYTTGNKPYNCLLRA